MSMEIFPLHETKPFILSLCCSLCTFIMVLLNKYKLTALVYRILVILNKEYEIQPKSQYIDFSDIYKYTKQMISM